MLVLNHPQHRQAVISGSVQNALLSDTADTTDISLMLSAEFSPAPYLFPRLFPAPVRVSLYDALPGTCRFLPGSWQSSSVCPSLCKPSIQPFFLCLSLCKPSMQPFLTASLPWDAVPLGLLWCVEQHAAYK